MANERAPVTISETDDRSDAPAENTPLGDRAVRYSARGLLGSGGMGEVHLRHDAWVGRDVAVKTLVPDRQSSGATRVRFLREARVQGQLEHPAIVPVYDVGVDERGNEYFTMKRVTGRTLAELLSTGDAPQNRLLALFRQVCLAVEYAHSRGVVHRDLKPDNIMVGDFGEVYVLDWGLAKVAGVGSGIEERSHGWGQTLAGQRLGTPGYMAPEQIESARDVDDRADVYALGAILFEVLAGSPLHPGHAEARIRSTELGVPLRPSERAPARQVPPELDALSLRATVRDPVARTVTAREIADAVERFLDGDRDLITRRELAGAHAERAAFAADEALRGGSNTTLGRATALREAGQALVLDPENAAAAATLLELMARPPSELPPEVVAEIDRADVLAMRIRNRKGLGMIAAFLALVLALPLAGFSDLRRLAVILVPLVLACVTSVLVFVTPDLSVARFERRTDWFVGLGLSAVAAISLVVTSSVIVPTVALALTMGAAGAARPRRRARYLAMGVLAFLIPDVLECFHVAPALLPGLSLIQGIAVFPLSAASPELVPLRIIITAATATSLLTPLLTLFPVLDAAADLRARSFLQAWHLRQLAPTQPERAT